MKLKIGSHHTALFVALLVVSSVAVGVTASAFGTTAATPEEAEPNDDQASATALEDEEVVNGSLDVSGDEDWYAMEMTAGDGLLANLTLTSEGNQSVRVDIYDPDGTQIGVIPRDMTFGRQNIAGTHPQLIASGDRARIADVAEANGTYYVRVARTHWDNETHDITYTLEVNSIPLDRFDPTGARDSYEPNEDGATATPVTLGEPIEAVFAPYDSDVYAVTVPAGTNITVTVTDDFRFDKALFVSDDPSIIDDDTYDGDYLAAVDDFRFKTVLTFTAEKGGTYYVQIVQGNTNNDLEGKESYTVTIEASTDGGDGTTGGDGTDDGIDDDTGTDDGTKDRGDCPT